MVTAYDANAILKAAPAVVSMPTPKAESQMGGIIPPRQAWAGGLAGIITWLICYFLAKYTSVVIPVELQAPISLIVGGIVASFVPPSVRDIIKNLNDTIVHIAQRDPESNVSYVLPPVQPPPGEPPVIIPPATKV